MAQPKLGVGHGANNTTLEKFTVTKPSKWRRSTQHCSASKEEMLSATQTVWYQMIGW
jgi:hypothetical protein